MPYFLVTIFLPFTILVEVDDERKVPPPPPPTDEKLDVINELQH